MQSAALLLLSLLFVVPAQAQVPELAQLLPDRVGSLILVQRVDGPEAQAEVNALHGKALTAEASVIGRYARPSAAEVERPAEVWISRLASEAEARRQIGLMVHRMVENPRSPFHHPRRLDRDGTAVYRFEGMGQTHYIWWEGDLAYWISASPSDEEAFLSAFCN